MNKNELINLVKSFCNDNGYSFTDDYSGRCMFGKLCIGIICDNTNKAGMDLISYLMQHSKLEPKEIQDILGTPSIDEMGKHMILYFSHCSRD